MAIFLGVTTIRAATTTITTTTQTFLSAVTTEQKAKIFGAH